MKSLFYSNQSIVYVVGAVIVLVILYFIFKALPIKVKKKETKEPEKKVEPVSKVEEKEPEKVEEVKSLEEEKPQEEDKKSKKEDKKPKIVQIYKREQKSENGEKKPRALDPIYDRNVEFVNTSKNIAKFKSFSEESKQEEIDKKESTDDFGFVQDVQEDCEFCENKVKHFDHSRRLSKAIKEDNFDNMFDSHISEKYLNINSDRHLKVDEKFSDGLFDRTAKMMTNSLGKLNMKQEEVLDNAQQKFSLFTQDEPAIVEEEFVDEDEVKVNMKTALIAETYFGKRKKK